MMTLKDLMSNTTQSSPDGRHWEPALPWPPLPLRYRLGDAWEVLCGRATAVRQTQKDDMKEITNG